MRTPIAAFIIANTLSAPVFAQSAEDLANLPRAEFLAEYETRLENSMVVQQELIARLSPEFRDNIDTSPVTDAEREGIACVYDAMAGQNQVILIAKQLMAYEIMKEKMEADPEFDLVSTMFDQEFLDSFANEIPDEAFEAMMECGLIELSSQRMDFSPELWEAMGQAAQERGYTDD